MESKKYKIKTLNDIINCTNEDNLDNFLTDLRGILTALYALRSLSEFIGETDAEKEMLSDGFTWIDDGKHNINISIKEKK